MKNIEESNTHHLYIIWAKTVYYSRHFTKFKETEAGLSLLVFLLRVRATIFTWQALPTINHHPWVSVTHDSKDYQWWYVFLKHLNSKVVVIQCYTLIKLLDSDYGKSDICIFYWVLVVAIIFEYVYDKRHYPISHTSKMSKSEIVFSSKYGIIVCLWQVAWLWIVCIHETTNHGQKCHQQ